LNVISSRGLLSCEVM